MSHVPALVVAFLLAGTFPASASDGAVSIPDYGTRITVPADGTGSLEFAHPAYDGARATVRIENGRVLAGTDNDALTLATYDPTSQWNDEMAVLLMDVDFDGYLDIGVLDGVGYGGVNFFWSFHRADSERLFVPVGTIPNPERDDILGTIRAPSRSGPFWTTEVYRPQGDGLHLQFSRTHWGEFDVVTFPGNGKGGAVQRGIIPTIAPDPWDAEALEDPGFHQLAISTNPGRAHFYDAPDETTRRAAYLVEGDEGRVTDVSQTGDWFFMVFTHPETDVTTTGWMRAEDLVLIQG
jgi:hypothetical protein